MLAQEDVLRSAYDALSRAARISAQSQLAMGGFYDGALDGTYGPRTRSGLINAAAFVTENSYGKATFDLSSPKGARAFVVALSQEKLAKYLWGEGDESDEG